MGWDGSRGQGGQGGGVSRAAALPGACLNLLPGLAAPKDPSARGGRSGGASLDAMPGSS